MSVYILGYYRKLQRVLNERTFGTRRTRRFRARLQISSYDSGAGVTIGGVRDSNA